MDKRTVIITGGNAGLGYQAAKNIASADLDYHVVLACRSRARGEDAASTLIEETGNPNITTMPLDLASFASIRAFADAMPTQGLPPLFGLVCNAGISAAGVPGTPTTDDGIEMIFGVNHLGHFLLSNLLLDQITDDGRVVFVTSDLHNPPRFFPAIVKYDSADAIAHRSAGMSQYCMSKLCNLYTTYEMDRRLKAHGSHITVNAFNPGAMGDTGFARPSANPIVRVAVAAISTVMSALIGKQSTAAESGAYLANLITSPNHRETSARYFDRGEITESSDLSHNEHNARELWEASTRMTGLDNAHSA